MHHDPAVSRVDHNLSPVISLYHQTDLHSCQRLPGQINLPLLHLCACLCVFGMLCGITIKSYYQPYHPHYWQFTVFVCFLCAASQILNEYRKCGLTLLCYSEWHWLTQGGNTDTGQTKVAYLSLAPPDGNCFCEWHGDLCFIMYCMNSKWICGTSRMHLNRVIMWHHKVTRLLLC